MSVVAWDSKFVAADRQATMGTSKMTSVKIKRLKDGTILGATGELSRAMTLFRWYESGQKEDTYPEFQEEDGWCNFIAVKKGRVYHYGHTSEPCIITDPFGAIGSGMDYAIGAMAMGADAIKAVEVASQFDINCGMGVDWFEIGKKKLSAKTE